MERTRLESTEWRPLSSDCNDRLRDVDDDSTAWLGVIHDVLPRRCSTPTQTINNTAISNNKQLDSDVCYVNESLELNE